MAQGVAYVARKLGVPCSVIVPDHAPETKLAAIERLGGRIAPIDPGSQPDALVRLLRAGLGAVAAGDPDQPG